MKKKSKDNTRVMNWEENGNLDRLRADLMPIVDGVAKSHEKEDTVFLTDFMAKYDIKEDNVHGRVTVTEARREGNDVVPVRKKTVDEEFYLEDLTDEDTFREIVEDFKEGVRAVLFRMTYDGT